MWGKLIEFVIFSRVPKRSLALYIALSLLLVIMTLPSYSHEPQYITREFSLFSIFYSTLLVVTSMFNTRFGMVSKSDSDFLAMLPIDDKMLVTSIIIGSLVVNLALSILFISWFILAVGVYGIFIPILLSFSSSSLPAIVYPLDNKRKILIAVPLAVWFFSASLGFPFSPMSMFIGYQIQGFTILSLFSISLFVLALSQFSFTKYSNVTITSEKGEVKEQISFEKAKSPLLAMLVKNLNVLEIGGRVNFMGTSTYVSRRVKLWQILLVTSLLGAGIYFVYLFKIFSLSTINFYVIIISWFLTVSLSSSALISEPIWLDINIMSPLEFFRNYLVSKAISLVVILLPIGIFEILSNQFILGLATITDLPLSAIFLISINSRFYRTSLQTIQTFTLGRFLVAFLSIIPFAVLEVIAFLPLPVVFLSGTLALVIISVPFFFWGSYWQTTIEKIVTSVT
ncbi:hypothetical protein [Stygiolobus caldivivus]|uniref:Uncharacterized protein n=1 Tax=Stygiolobus caldivivus TaxID=2824673 RepID=A0A8D5U703_9CREN|nr:hypothetical protein [Stygiolobus caldivivus]BCU70377.1 hypothetical protein KN1_16740 [Stygiolobus caldivivus]